MRDTNEYFGRNAGKVWVALNVHGPLKEDALLKKTRLDEEAFYAAVGWLARENKIYRTSGKKYQLKETNLTSSIGRNAGKIFKTLCNKDDIDVSTIAKSTKIKKRDAYSALGWLAREDKIETKTKKKGKAKKQVFSLK